MSRREILQRIAYSLVSVECAHPLRVAVDGIDASGKSTWADHLAAEVEILGRPVIRSTIDGFHNPSVVRYRRGRSSPEGYFHDSFNYRSVLDCILLPLGPGGSRRYRSAVFDWRSDQIIDFSIQEAPENSILLFDGIFLQRPEVAGFWEAKIFIRVPFTAALANAEKRFLAANGQKGQSAALDELRRIYRIRYFPAQEEYRESIHPEEKADILIDNSDFDNPSLVWNRL